METFQNKTVIVTGGASGIGKGIVQLFSQSNAYVIIADVDEEKGKLLEEELQSKNDHCKFVKTDVKNENDIIQLMDVCKRTYGDLHYLINNAGISKFHTFLDMEIQAWDEVINTNLRSVFLCTREAAKIMGPGSSVVNIASTRAFMSEPNTEAYAASKGGIVAITHALARTLGEKGIRVNCISPGWIDTGNYEKLSERDHKQHLSQRVGKPDDIARCCLFLCNPENDFITGENIMIDGGMTRKMLYEE